MPRDVAPCQSPSALSYRSPIDPAPPPDYRLGSMSARVVVIIPARFGSTRLPGKALAMIDGRPMVRHVAERARAAHSVERVIVATDDDRIRSAVAPTGVEVVMTRADHPSGTDRLAEVASGLDAEVIINVQGDLPLLDPEMIDRLGARMLADPALPMGTLVTPIRTDAEWQSPHVVKVAIAADGRALYFSRAPIPYDHQGRFGWRHIGMYAYRRLTLLQLAALPPSPLELREKLEQLRALEHGIPIGIVEWAAAEPLIEVDTAEDLEQARAAVRATNTVSSRTN